MRPVDLALSTVDLSRNALSCGRCKPRTIQQMPIRLDIMFQNRWKSFLALQVGGELNLG